MSTFSGSVHTYRFPSVLKLHSKCDEYYIENIKNLDSSLYLFYSAEKQIVKHLLSYENDSSVRWTGIAQWFRSISREHLANKNLKGEQKYDYLLKRKDFLALILLINYSINEVYGTKNFSLMFYGYVARMSESEDEFIKAMYKIYKDIYERYFDYNVLAFHNTVASTFQKYINYLDQDTNEKLEDFKKNIR